MRRERLANRYQVNQRVLKRNKKGTSWVGQPGSFHIWQWVNWKQLSLIRRTQQSKLNIRHLGYNEKKKTTIYADIKDPFSILSVTSPQSAHNLTFL